MNNFQDLLKNSQKLQALFKNAQSEMSKVQVTGVAGAGMISVTMNGRYQVLQIAIEDEAWQEGKAFIEELMSAAVNDAITKVQEASQNKMSQFASTISSSTFNTSDTDEKTEKE